MEEGKCLYKCNYNCCCDKERLILQVNEVCNKKCKYCIQIENSYKSSVLDFTKVDEVFARRDWEVLGIVGGEFSLLSKEEQLYIFSKIRNDDRDAFIATNNMELTYPGVNFDRHILDFNYIPESTKKYNMVMTNDELEQIYEYLKHNNHIEFKLHYDRSKPINRKNKALMLAILSLSNMHAHAHGLIKSCMKSSGNNFHTFLCSILSKICAVPVVKAYKLKNEYNTNKFSNQD